MPAMSLHRDVKMQLIRTIGLFSGCTIDELHEVAAIADEIDLRAGKLLTTEDTDGREFVVIIEGQAEVAKHGEVVATIGPGDYFGEIALIDGGPRSATIVAATDLVCYGLTFWEFRPLVEGNGSIGWKLLQALAKRLRAADG